MYPPATSPNATPAEIRAHWREVAPGQPLTFPCAILVRDRTFGRKNEPVTVERAYIAVAPPTKPGYYVSAWQWTGGEWVWARGELNIDRERAEPQTAWHSCRAYVPRGRSSAG
jgi:hypothetical protein